MDLLSDCRRHQLVSVRKPCTEHYVRILAPGYVASASVGYHKMTGLPLSLPLDSQLLVAHLLHWEHDLLLHALSQLEVELVSVFRHWTVQKKRTSVSVSLHSPFIVEYCCITTMTISLVQLYKTKKGLCLFKVSIKSATHKYFTESQTGGIINTCVCVCLR